MKDIQFRKRRNTGVITISRERALHAQTSEMLSALSATIDRWETDPSIHQIVITSTGHRAFCAGADIRFFYANGLEFPEKTWEFCQNEYSLNQKLYHLSKPYIAFINGIVMGGGVGLSQYANYRIATENYLFAMPEVGIGFFPDVGSSYFLSRLPDYFGYYLALTGNTIDRETALSIGIATHSASSSDLEELEKRIVENETLEKVFLPPALSNDTFYHKHREEIREGFSQESLVAIFQKLEAMHSSFAKETLDCLNKRSPLSLHIAFQLLKQGASGSFDDVIAMDKKIAKKLVRTKDLYEGIRAQVIDKDKMPRWSYPSVQAVPSGDISKFT